MYEGHFKVWDFDGNWRIQQQLGTRSLCHHQLLESSLSTKERTLKTIQKRKDLVLREVNFVNVFVDCVLASQ